MPRKNKHPSQSLPNDTIRDLEKKYLKSTPSVAPASIFARGNANTPINTTTTTTTTTTSTIPINSTEPDEYARLLAEPDLSDHHDTTTQAGINNLAEELESFIENNRAKKTKTGQFDIGESGTLISPETRDKYREAMFEIDKCDMQYKFLKLWKEDPVFREWFKGGRVLVHSPQRAPSVSPSLTALKSAFLWVCKSEELERNEMICEMWEGNVNLQTAIKEQQNTYPSSLILPIEIAKSANGLEFLKRYLECFDHLNLLIKTLSLLEKTLRNNKENPHLSALHNYLVTRISAKKAKDFASPRP